MSWIDQFSGASPRDAEDLLKSQQTVEWNALGMFATHLGIAITITLAVVGASVAAVNSDHSVICFAAFGAPSLVAGVRWFAIASLDRYYGRFLEAVTVQQKLRFVLERPNGATQPFPGDTTLDVARYWGREPGDSSRWIAESMLKGHNRVAWLLFRWLFAFSFVPAVLGAARLLAWPANSGGPDPPPEIVVWGALLIGVIVAVLASMFGTKWVTKQRRESHGSA